MAITQCPGCGGKVSTKAEACPHCGSPVEPQQSQINCPECEEDFGLSLAVCPHCGVPNPKHHWQSSASLQTRQSEMAWRSARQQTGRLTPRRAARTFIQQGSSQSSGSGAFGILLIFAGIVVAGYFVFGYDTTVGATNTFTGEYMGRVTNIGLTNNRLIGVMIGAAVFFVGAIVALSSKSKK